MGLTLLLTAVDSFLSDCCCILRTVGSNLNGPVTGNPLKEPLPKQEPKPKGRMQRSKSFPWERPPSVELRLPLPSFDEQDKESPVEVFINFLKVIP